MNRFSLLALFVSLVLVVSACGAQAPEAPEPIDTSTAEVDETPTEEADETPTEEATEEPDLGTIVEVAEEEDDLSTLVSALEAADLAETLGDEGPFTVFAPTDEAFEAIGEETLDALLDDTETLEQILLYHVVEGEVLAEDVIGLDEAETVQGESISITVTLNDSATLVDTDIMASNGVIHTIDSVLLPPDVTLPTPEGAMEEATEDSTIADVVSTNEDFSTLLTALEAAALVETLSGEGPFTVFAPTNEAFEAIDEETLNALLEDPETLEQVLLYHVVEGEVLAEDVVGLDEATTVQGEPVTITVDGETVTLNDTATVTETDIMASNGVIHVIDSVLLPPDVTLPEADGEMAEDATEEPEPGTIVEVAQGADDLSTLVSALEAAELVETLGDEGPFTVFAPTNAAFEAIGEETLNALLDDTETLEQILLYHVVEDEVLAEDVIGLDEAETVQGESISISVTLNDSATLVETDIMASNGVIHTIDSVLLPPDVTLPESEEATPEATDEATPEATEEAATEGATTEATPEATEEAATEGATTEATPEATEEAATEGATTEATPEATEEAATEGNTIADVVSTNENFSTLLTAVETAGLVETLSGAGPFTVFAPTNEAFAAIDEATLNALLEDPETLEQVLLYHVVEGEVLAADVVGLDEATTVQGQPITITVDGETVTLNDTATVVETDITASNGVIHVIDSVLLPPDVTLPTPEGTMEEATPEATEEAATEGNTIADVVSTNENFSTLLTAVETAGLVETLSGEGPFTVFAPTNAAFAAIDEATLNALLADPATLEQVLLYHVVEGEVLAADVVGLSEATTVQGQPITIMVDGETVTLNDSATVVETDITASNGVIHVIDSVLLPPDVTLPAPDGEGEATEGETHEDEAMEEATATP